MATVTEGLALIGDYLQDIDDSDRLTETMALRSINRGYVQFARDTSCFNRTTTISSVAEQAEYTLPLDVTSPLRVVYDETELSPTTRELLNIDDAGWQEAASGTPAYWYRASATEIGLYPVPATAVTDGISVFCQICPSDVTGGIALLSADSPTLTPAVPYPYQEAPFIYAIFDLAAHVLQDDPAAIQSGKMALAEYQSLVKEFRGSMVTEGAF
jgi:hypothetical protein